MNQKYHSMTDRLFFYHINFERGDYMGNNVSKEQIKIARHADLYAFLMKYHNSDFKTEGDSIRPKSNHSISIKKNYNGYKDFVDIYRGKNYIINNQNLYHNRSSPHNGKVQFTDKI